MSASAEELVALAGETSAPASADQAADRKAPLLKASALRHAVVLALVAGLAVAAWLVGIDGGWAYYSTPIRVRGYSPAHAALRPSGPVGNLVGVVGTLFMLLTLLYLVRKRVKRLSKAGTMKGWLEFHIFCGVFGPILVTFHTSFKFNGIVSVAYWSMLLVVLSGFVGRYLYVRIPKTIRGTELSGAEIEARIRALKERLAESGVPAGLLLEIERVEVELSSRPEPDRSWVQLTLDSLRARRSLAPLRRRIRGSGMRRELLKETLDTVEERAYLLRRIGQLNRTRKLFEMWHVFHRPLVWVMFTIFAVHLTVALYFGYTFLRK